MNLNVFSDVFQLCAQKASSSVLPASALTHGCAVTDSTTALMDLTSSTAVSCISVVTCRVKKTLKLNTDSCVM